MSKLTSEQELIVETAIALGELRTAFGTIDRGAMTLRQRLALFKAEKCCDLLCRHAVQADFAPLLLRAEQMVENPSAWETFDQAASEIIAELVAELRQQAAEHELTLDEIERQERRPI